MGVVSAAVVVVAVVVCGAFTAVVAAVPAVDSNVASVGACSNVDFAASADILCTNSRASEELKAPLLFAAITVSLSTSTSPCRCVVFDALNTPPLPPPFVDVLLRDGDHISPLRKLEKSELFHGDSTFSNGSPKIDEGKIFDQLPTVSALLFLRIFMLL